MAKWEDFSVSKEFKLWYNLKEMCLQYEINESKLISYKDLTDYWEPLFDKLFRLGLQFKHTGKLKEIKSEWMRPLFWSGIEEKIIIDGKFFPKDPLDKDCIYKAQELKRNFSEFITALLEYDRVDSTNFKKLKKSLQDCSKEFFKNLIQFVTKKLYDKLKGFCKDVLRPLLDIRKANYHLFLLEKKEENDNEITFFNDKKDMKLFTETVSQFFSEEEVRLKKDCDVNQFEDYLNRNTTKAFYQYSYAPKIREGFTYKENTKIRKDILQKKFEEGMSSFLKYLFDKKNDEFYCEIDVHKLFKNLQIPKVNELKPLKFYISTMQNLLREYKEKLYEMKLNGLTRIKMPITENHEIVGLQKKIFDLDILIDTIMGDKLKYDQYLFIYNALTYIVESNIKEEITIFKDKNFMEDILPKYIIYNSLRNSVNILAKMKEKIKSNGEIFSLDLFYQPEKHQLDTENTHIINSWYYTEQMKKIVNVESEETKSRFFKEVDEFGSRFWILEGFFNPQDRELWLEAINILKDINVLVQDDIRDFIILNYEHSKKNVESKRDLSKKESMKDGHRVSNSKLSSMKSIKQKEIRMTSSKGKKVIPIKRPQHQEKPEKSFESEDESILNAKGLKSNTVVNIDNLRPPHVWNFPIDLMHKKMKEEEKKIEIRNVDPRNYYKDGRVKNFLEILNKIKIKMLEYSAEKKNILWKYHFDCILKIHGIVYNFYPEEKKQTQKTNEDNVTEN